MLAVTLCRLSNVKSQFHMFQMIVNSNGQTLFQMSLISNNCNQKLEIKQNSYFSCTKNEYHFIAVVNFLSNLLHINLFFISKNCLQIKLVNITKYISPFDCFVSLKRN